MRELMDDELEAISGGEIPGCQAHLGVAILSLVGSVALNLGDLARDLGAHRDPWA